MKSKVYNLRNTLKKNHECKTKDSGDFCYVCYVAHDGTDREVAQFYFKRLEDL